MSAKTIGAAAMGAAAAMREDTMSGTGGGGGYQPRQLACEKLSINTVLGSPKAPVVAQLRKGHVLSLVLQTGATKLVTAVINTGQVAGTITTMTQQLIECMEDGHAFEAEVTQINVLQVSVQVRPK